MPMIGGVPVRLFLRELLASVQRNENVDVAAQLAYFALLSLFPFGIFVLTVIGYLPLAGLDRELMSLIYEAMPQEAAALLDKTLHEVLGRQRSGLLLVSLFGTIWSASSGVSALVTALNRALGVRETRSYVRRKLVAMGVTLSAALLTIVATSALLVGPELLHTVLAWLGFDSAFDLIWRWLRLPLALLAMISLLALVYHLLPAKRPPLRPLSLGSVTAVLLWLSASLGLRTYVGHFGAYAKTYGTLGTAVVLMTWLYLSGLAVILGGEIDAVLARLKGSRPGENSTG
jgi:membrane protein